MRGLIAVSVVAAVGVAAGSALAGVNGTWSGRFIIPQEVGNVPSSAYPTAKLVVSAASVSAEFHGKTMAAHDPESAVSTCSMRFRFRRALSAAGWRIYEEVGKPVISGSGAAGGGMPDLSECFQHDPSGDSRVVLRVRSAGTKLKAQFGLRFGEREPEYGSGGLSGYLHH
jgi:hypothetical protein